MHKRKILTKIHNLLQIVNQYRAFNYNEYAKKIYKHIRYEMQNGHTLSHQFPG